MINWNNFIRGEAELECKNLEDAELLLSVCKENGISCNHINPKDYKYEPYWYVNHWKDLVTTMYSCDNEDICSCWTVKDFINEHTH